MHPVPKHLVDYVYRLHEANALARSERPRTPSASLASPLRFDHWVGLETRGENYNEG